jgi:hypothetical protein
MDDEWMLQEVAESADRPLAKFYAGLDEGDRAMFAGQHIDLHHDLREVPLECSAS